MNENMTIAEYEEIYEKIIALSVDADGFGLFENISNEDAEKCIWIAAILDVLNDVPVRRMKHIFEQKKMIFDSEKFWEENFEI